MLTREQVRLTAAHVLVYMGDELIARLVGMMKPWHKRHALHKVLVKSFGVAVGYKVFDALLKEAGIKKGV